MAADVAFADRAQQGVTEGVADHVRVGMAEQPFVPGDFYATENQLTSRD
jgi:hypothetical protein